MAPPRNYITDSEGNLRMVRRIAAATEESQSVEEVGKKKIIPRILVIMAEFEDQKFATATTKAVVDSMFNAQNWRQDGATGSVRQYFRDQSMGQYDPQFDIVGPVKAANNVAYYGKSNSATSALIPELCTLVNDSVDFTRYDNDGDGYIDMVFVYFAGFGENDPPIDALLPISCNQNYTNLIWPHYSTTSARISYAGKQVRNYEVSNELDGYYTTETKTVVAGIGVLVHEFCHGLGLPDLYSTQNQYDHKTWGKWDVMDYGSYNNDMHTPPALSAYERYFLGWLEPELLVEAQNDTLSYLGESNHAYIVTKDDKMPTNTKTGPFYILENRQKKGWDIDIPGEGLMISKIESWTTNGVNNDRSNQKIDLIEADGITAVNGTNSDPIWYGKKGDLFPTGAESITLFTDGAVTEIKMENSVIHFLYKGGKGPVTQIETYTGDEQTRPIKRLVNGQVVIEQGGNRYNLLGMRL